MSVNYFSVSKIIWKLNQFWHIAYDVRVFLIKIMQAKDFQLFKWTFSIIKEENIHILPKTDQALLIKTHFLLIHQQLLYPLKNMVHLQQRAYASLFLIFAEWTRFML